MPYDFMYVEKQKVQLTNAELKSIGKLYEQWAKDIEKEWGNKATNSQLAADKRLQMMKLRTALKREADYISEQVEKSIKTNIYIMSNHVVDAMYENLKNLGINSKALRASMATIPQNVVENIVSGAIYGGGAGHWRLSKAIWGDNSQTLSSLYKIVGGGIAQNKSIYEIANELSKYVNPRAAKQWNLKDSKGVSIYPKKVEYSAQRLARTLSQHAYQQSIVQTTLKNPMVLGIRWRANGSRVCDICKARDGQVYPKDELPLDHPNGMCVMEPIYLADSDKMIADWVNSPAGTYPSMDAWAKELGYDFDGNNPTTPVANIMRNEDNKKVAKQNYKNDQPFNPQVWLDDEARPEFIDHLEKYRAEQKTYIGASDAYKKTIDDYTASLYYDDLNAWLRGDRELERMSSYVAERVPDLDKELESMMKNSYIPNGTYVQREGSLDEFSNVFGIDRKTLYNANVFKDQELYDEMASKVEGKVVEIKNYMSTHTRRGYFRNDCQMYIKVNDNVHGMYVTDFSHFGHGEDEILFDKNIKFIVNKVDKSPDGRVRIYMETMMD